MGKIRTIVLLSSTFGLIAVSARAQPDLVVNKPRLAASLEVQKLTFSAGDCSVVEGCVGEGTRKLLKFDVGFQNAGNADLIIGDPNARPDLFEASPCHGHFHMRGVADYDLLSNDGSVVVRARKQGWCFRDNVPFAQGAGAAQYTCENQGISAGWEDIYDKSLDCQWLDVTGVPGGQYRLRVTVNPDRVFEESNYGNNTVTVVVTLPGAAKASPPPQAVAPTKPKPKIKKHENPWKKLKDKAKHKKQKKKKGKAKGHAKQDHDD